MILTDSGLRGKKGDLTLVLPEKAKLGVQQILGNEEFFHWSKSCF